MSTLVSQLEQLKKQQEGLQERIYEEEENKKKLNNEASIDRLEALVEPLTELLDYVRQLPVELHEEKSLREASIERLKREWAQYYRELKTKRNGDNGHIPKKSTLLVNEEIFVTLIGILKKQDERIKELEVKTKSYLY